MLGTELMDKNSGNEGGAIINISSMSGECLNFDIFFQFSIGPPPHTCILLKLQLHDTIRATSNFAISKLIQHLKELAGWLCLGIEYDVFDVTSFQK